MTKKELRLEIKRKRDGLSTSYINESGAIIENRVVNSEAFKKSEYIFVYINTENEPSTSKIISCALESGKKVFVPKCVGKGIMAAVNITSLSELKSGAYGIYEPVSAKESPLAEKITLAIVPCVSASADGRRLGHGGGYYDRFFERSDIFRLCICFEELLSDKIPVEDYDIRMNAVFTENAEYFCEV